LISIMADEGSKPMTNNGELTDGVGSSPSQPEGSTQLQFVHLPQELHDPRGVGVRSEGDEKPHFVHLPLQIRNPRGAGISMQPEGGESDTATQTQGTVAPQEVNSPSKFGHGLPHFHNPRGVGISPNGDPGLTLGPQAHIPHLPQLHDPRGVSIRNPRGMPIQGHGGEVDECGPQDGSENVE